MGRDDAGETGGGRARQVTVGLLAIVPLVALAIHVDGLSALRRLKATVWLSVPSPEGTERAKKPANVLSEELAATKAKRYSFFVRR